MNKKTLFISVVIMLFLGFSLVYGLVEKEMTKEQMLVELKEDLADNSEVFNMAPGLRASAAANGSVVYTYSGTALDDLSKKDLTKLYSRVHQALVKIRTDRIQRQLETAKKVKRLQDSADVQQPPHLPASAPSPPKSPPSLPPVPRRR